MLEADGVRVYYGLQEAVKGVSFSVGAGELVALVGANGAGKSTILKALSGLLHPRAGRITFCGEEITHTDAWKLPRRGLAYVPEGRRIFAHMTVEENLKMGAYCGKRREKSPLEQVYTCFPQLKTRHRQTAGTLSGGEQQMLAIGRALMSRPKLMMLDEPSMGLAPMLSERIFAIIAGLRAEGTTILLVEQNAARALSLADRAYVLENGRITLSGSGPELKSHDAVKKAYLGG